MSHRACGCTTPYRHWYRHSPGFSPSGKAEPDARHCHLATGASKASLGSHRLCGGRHICLSSDRHSRLSSDAGASSLREAVGSSALARWGERNGRWWQGAVGTAKVAAASARLRALLCVQGVLHNVPCRGGEQAESGPWQEVGSAL
ncbi:hypothetical protein NDU88_011464 [Pleurodeles waltl]|uniref:Uncharacterized protein n=1 Tax=Pleurodeles waltl TaxID=8319 RepID=A0AAV7R346_PLEWA|nr:hypothetical protein NDU88_011464 [Pleurodeles waltl]